VKSNQEQLQVDKQRKKKQKTQAATTPTASTWNITADTDGLKPQDDTVTAC